MPDAEPGPLARAYLHGSRGVFVPFAAIRLAGDPGAALLFGQLLWLTTQAHHAPLVRREGHDWLVRPYDGWADDTGLSGKQARTAIGKLGDAGLTEARRWKHDGAPTTHLRVRWDALEVALAGQMDLPEKADRTAPEGGTMDLPERADVPLSETGETTDTETSTADAAGEPGAVEVVDPVLEAAEALCVHLADRVEGNGANRPEVTKRWRDAARLMLTKDGRTAEQVRNAIDWCQDDEFWRANVLSMPKLRERYEQLRLQALRAGVRQGRRPSAVDLAAEYDAAARGEVATG